MPKIAYRSEDFPAHLIANGDAELDVSWSDILWASLTVGRPNKWSLFSHGTSSVAEAIMRLSMVRTGLQTSAGNPKRFSKTSTFKGMDSSERGAINYFLGMMTCKLFAEKLLHTPWLLHLDVWKHHLQAVTNGKSRPDLVGWSKKEKKWSAFEAKGRYTSPNLALIKKAKSQSEQLTSVKSAPISLHVATFSYFDNDDLHFYWRDPESGDGKKIDVPFESKDLAFSYQSVLALYDDIEEAKDVPQQGEIRWRLIKALDIEVGFQSDVLGFLREQDWKQLYEWGREHEPTDNDGYYSDGMAVRAGESWTNREGSGV